MFLSTEPDKVPVPSIPEVISNTMASRKRKGGPGLRDVPNISLLQEADNPRFKRGKRRAEIITTPQALPEDCVSSPHAGPSTEVQKTLSGETDSATANDPPLERLEDFILRWTILTDTELGK